MKMKNEEGILTKQNISLIKENTEEEGKNLITNSIVNNNSKSQLREKEEEESLNLNEKLDLNAKTKIIKVDKISEKN